LIECNALSLRLTGIRYRPTENAYGSTSSYLISLKLWSQVRYYYTSTTRLRAAIRGGCEEDTISLRVRYNTFTTYDTLQHFARSKNSMPLLCRSLLAASYRTCDHSFKRRSHCHDSCPDCPRLIYLFIYIYLYLLIVDAYIVATWQVGSPAVPRFRLPTVMLR